MPDMPELPEVEVTRIGSGRAFARRAGAHGARRFAAALAAGCRRARPSRSGNRRTHASRQIHLDAVDRARAQRRPAVAPGHVGFADAARARAAAPRPARSLRTGQQRRHVAPDRPAPLRRGAVVRRHRRRSRRAGCSPAWAPSRSTRASPRRPCTPPASGGAARSRPRCWPATWSSAPATSTRARRLFRAGIDPRTRCHRLSLARCERLLVALREVLSQALALGGSTLRDFRDAHGSAGEFQANARRLRARGPALSAAAARRCGASCRRSDRPSFARTARRGSRTTRAAACDRQRLRTLWRPGPRCCQQLYRVPVGRQAAALGSSGPSPRLLHDLHPCASPGRPRRLASRARPLGRAVFGLPGRPRTARRRRRPRRSTRCSSAWPAIAWCWPSWPSSRAASPS